MIPTHLLHVSLYVFLMSQSIVDDVTNGWYDRTIVPRHVNSDNLHVVYRWYSQHIHGQSCKKARFCKREKNSCTESQLVKAIYGCLQWLLWNSMRSLTDLQYDKIWFPTTNNFLCLMQLYHSMRHSNLLITKTQVIYVMHVIQPNNNRRAIYI